MLGATGVCQTFTAEAAGGVSGRKGEIPLRRFQGLSVALAHSVSLETSLNRCRHHRVLGGSCGGRIPRLSCWPLGLTCATLLELSLWALVILSIFLDLAPYGVVGWMNNA